MSAFFILKTAVVVFICVTHWESFNKGSVHCEITLNWLAILFSWLFKFSVWSCLSGKPCSQFSPRHTKHTFKVFVVDPQVCFALLKSFLYDRFLLMALSLALTATPEGLRVRQYPPSLSVMQGETATLSCHFKVESLKYGVQRFKMKSEKHSSKSHPGWSLWRRSKSSSLVIVITAVAQVDSSTAARWTSCRKIQSGATAPSRSRQIACYRNSW